MRILHICQRDDPDIGGSLSVADALVREQRSNGLDAWLLFLYGEASSVFQSLGEKVICLGLKSSSEALAGIGALRKAIRQIAPDIIHSHDGILWPRLVFFLLRTPVVMHTHLPITQERTNKNRLGGVMVKATTKMLVGISLHTIESWVKDGYPPSQIHYVPNGVDQNRFAIGTKEIKQKLRQQHNLPVDKHILLWVGRLHQQVKGTDRVERIAALLPDGMVVVVVGNGEEYEGMHERCKGLIDEGRMVMAGSTSIPEKYYQLADSYLFTSYREAFGLVILEAAFSGLPILAFPVTEGGGAIGILQEFEASMVDDSDSNEAIEAKLSALLDQNEPCVQSRERAIAKYSLASVSRKVI